MLEFHSSSTTAVSTKRAVAECLENALGGSLDCDLIIFYTTMGHNFTEMLSEFRKLSPGARIAGCTCTGVIGREGPSESMRSLAIMAVRGPRSELAVAGRERGAKADSRERARSLAQDLKRENPAVSIVLFQPSAHGVFPEGALEGVESVFGPDVPVIGGLATDNGKLVSDFQFVDDRTFEQGAMAVGFADPTIELVDGANHGFPVMGDPLIVTRADRYRVIEMNGQPAWTAWAAALGLPPTAGPWELVAAPLVRDLPEELHDEYGSAYLHVIYSGSPRGDGTIHVTSTCPEGTRLWLSRRDEQGIFAGVDRMVKGVVERCGGRRPVAVFQADCNTRGRQMFNRVLKEEIVSRVQGPLRGNGDVPWLGMYGGGEYCRLGGRNRIHAFTSSLYVFLKREA
jgi:hypothetical protein